MHLHILVSIYGTNHELFALELQKMRFFKFVPRVTQKSFNLYSWNHIGISMGMWTCAPSYFGFNIWTPKWVICPWIVKNEVFKFVSYVTQKAFGLHPWNFIALSMMMWTCAPPYFGFIYATKNKLSALEFKKNEVFMSMSCITQECFKL